MEQREDDAAEERRKLLEEFMAPTYTGGASKPTVTDIGQIQTMTLPDDFVQGPSRSGTAGNSMFQEYHLKSDADIKVYFQYRGRRMSNAGAREFQSVLSQPPHTLKQAELDKVSETLRDKSDHQTFRIMSAKTQDINGKRVLIVDGQYLKHGLYARTMYVDSDKTGSVVQEITFQTPMSKLTSYLAKGVKSQESIAWK